jgi:DNA-binding response OmpR family regulator
VYGNVLIVEDEDTLRWVIAANLRRRGHRVREAATARQAIEALLGERADLLLLDTNLPDRSGWDLAREMRERAIDVPTIVVSAAEAAPDRLAELRPPAFLSKPFPLEELLRLVAGPAEAAASAAA